jgi:putative ABC transport system substrate-binding protein
MRKWIMIAAGLALLVVAAAAVKRRPKGDGKKVVAIVTLMSQPALDAVVAGVKDELRRQGFAEGRDIEFIEKNASGQVNLASGIANELNARSPDLIVSVTTPMTQAVVKVANCPVVFAAVTDPVGSNIVNSLDGGDANVTGVSDAWPYEEQLKLIRRMTGGVKRVGVLFNPGEAASQHGVSELRKFAPGLGLELVDGTLSSTSDVYPVAENLAGRVDALLISSDNTAISGAAGALKVALNRKIPLYVGDSGTVARGGLAAVSAGYTALGTDAGKLAARVLRGERHIPVILSNSVELYINSKAAELIGVKVPDDMLAEAAGVFPDIK